MKGKIITIEGLDGAGKSTQIELLTQKFESLGIKYKFIHFPMLQSGVYGRLIAEFLRGEFGSLEDVHPKLVALLFAEDRNEHKKTLTDWLEQGYYIIMDRYVNSNIAFQCAKVIDDKEKEELKKWILDFEFQTNQLPPYSQSFFLDVPLAVIEKSLSKAREGDDRDYLNGKTDIHEDSLDLQHKVYREYLKLIEEQPKFTKIDCFSSDQQWLDAESISQQIFTKIDFDEEISKR